MTMYKTMLAELLSDAISEQDESLLAMLQTELRTVREWILGNKQSPKVVFEKLESIRQQIESIEHRGVQNALTILQGQAGHLASIAGQHAAREIQSALANERNIRRKSFKTELSPMSRLFSH